jgi:hypothetical protein
MWAELLADADTCARFASKVYRRGDDCCHPWLAGLGADGHGVFRAGSRTTGTSVLVGAHVFAFYQAFGPPERPGYPVVIRHRCDESACCNPAHLLAGTTGENIADYQTRRYRVGGPLADARGAAGRALAIREAITTCIAAGGDTAAIETAITTARTIGDPQRNQLRLLDPVA